MSLSHQGNYHHAAQGQASPVSVAAVGLDPAWVDPLASQSDEALLAAVQPRPALPRAPRNSGTQDLPIRTNCPTIQFTQDFSSGSPAQLPNVAIAWAATRRGCSVR